MYIAPYRKVIWKQMMTGDINLVNWTRIAPSRSIVWRTSLNNNSMCPYSGENCWEICGSFSNNDSQYMYRMASTVGYVQIQLSYSIKQSVIYDWQFCEIYYTIDSNTTKNAWRLIKKFTTGDSTAINKVYSFNVNADDNDGVGIFIYANTSTDNKTGCCHLRDWKLTGIPISTSTTTSTTTSTSVPTNSSSTLSTSSPPSGIHCAIYLVFIQYT